MNILRFLQTVDRRVLYVLLMLSVSAPFFMKVKLPMRVSPATQKLYDTIEKLNEGDFVLLAADWGAGTRGENGPQTEAVLNHLMRKKVRFATLSFEPASPPLCAKIMARIAPQYGYKENENWVNFGYRVDAKNFLKGFIQDIPGVIKNNSAGQSVASLPVMQGIRTANDIKFIMSVTPSSVYQTYIQFVAGARKIPMGVAPTSVIVPEVFNYLDSEQIVGMMPGLPGAGEYEALLGISTKVSGFSNSASFAHILIIAFIIMGNVAMILERRKKAQEEGAE